MLNINRIYIQLRLFALCFQTHWVYITTAIMVVVALSLLFFATLSSFWVCTPHKASLSPCRRYWQLTYRHLDDRLIHSKALGAASSTLVVAQRASSMPIPSKHLGRHVSCIAVASVGGMVVDFRAYPGHYRGINQPGRSLGILPCSHRPCPQYQTAQSCFASRSLARPRPTL